MRTTTQALTIAAMLALAANAQATANISKTTSEVIHEESVGYKNIDQPALVAWGGSACDTFSNNWVLLMCN